MPRKKLSEFRAKTLLYASLEQSYEGVSIDTTAEWQAEMGSIDQTCKYVVKVDQGVKGRYKRGLVKLGRAHSDIVGDIEELSSKGFRYLLVEPQFDHPMNSEHYLAFERQRTGNIISFSNSGGVNVEVEAKAIRRAPFSTEVAKRAADALGVPIDTLKNLEKSFDENYFSFLEINPFVVTNDKAHILDAAAEVDSEATFFVDERWAPADFRSYETANMLPEVEAVETLAAQSQASFRLAVLNPNGSIFLLLSGGGASVVLADEVFNQGLGRMLGNYGEYSGNPNTEETFIYTRQIISLMLKSTAPHKVLVIAGGVANFTDVRATFKGVIAALDEAKETMREQGIKVFVRRGGPFEVEGLSMMRSFLEQAGLLGEVSGPELMLASIITQATAGWKVV